MHDLENLKEMLIKELEEFGKSGNLSKASLETIDKLAHAAKNVCKVIDSCEEEKYSNAIGRYSREGVYEPGHTYRDMGYSRSDDNLRGQLYKMMEMSSDEATRDKLRRFIDSI